MTTIELHAEICKYLTDLYERKKHDYGDSFHKIYLEEGLAMSRIRLGDKFSRFKNLSKMSGTQTRSGMEMLNNGIIMLSDNLTPEEKIDYIMKHNDQAKVTDESIVDTLLDLANYAIMTVIELEREKREKPIEDWKKDSDDKKGEINNG